jgi:hypothetical protein
LGLNPSTPKIEKPQKGTPRDFTGLLFLRISSLIGKFEGKLAMRSEYYLDVFNGMGMF